MRTLKVPSSACAGEGSIDRNLNGLGLWPAQHDNENSRTNQRAHEQSRTTQNNSMEMREGDYCLEFKRKVEGFYSMKNKQVHETKLVTSNLGLG